MSSAALADDLGAFLRSIGLPAAGPNLTTEAATHAERFVNESAASPHDALHTLALAWVEKCVGDDIVAELPSEMASEVLLALAAAAWKKTAPADRNRVQEEVWKSARDTLAARKRLRESLTRSPSKAEPSPSRAEPSKAEPAQRTSPEPLTPTKRNIITQDAANANPLPQTNAGKEEAAAATTQEQAAATKTTEAQKKKDEEAQKKKDEEPQDHQKKIEAQTRQEIHNEIRSSVARALAEAKTNKKKLCSGCGFKPGKCICMRASPARADPTPPPPENPKSTQQVVDAAGGTPDNSSSDSSSDSASENEAQSGFGVAGCGAKNALKWERLAGAAWEDEAVILNPALWQTRLAQTPGQEWELFRAMERRWLTPLRPGKGVQAESLRKLAVDNLKFFVRLAGSTPTPETTRWAIRNVDELETSAFIEAGASPQEIDEFKRRLLGEDRPSRYKTAWKTKRDKQQSKRRRDDRPPRKPKDNPDKKDKKP